jgi:hypothetical protein
MSDSEQPKWVPDDEPELTTEEHDAWFRGEVERALNQPGPRVPHEEVMREMRERIEAIRLRQSPDERNATAQSLS